MISCRNGSPPGVATPTVYNHFEDKHALLRESVTLVAQAVGADCVAVLDRLRATGEDPRAALDDVAHRLLRVCDDERSHALRCLAYGHPELITLVRDQTAGRTLDALTDRLARLTLAGKLRAEDPEVAAEQLLALLAAPL